MDDIPGGGGSRSENKKGKNKNMSTSVRHGSRQRRDLWIFMLTEVWSGSCQMTHAHNTDHHFLSFFLSFFFFFFATSGFSFSCYWEQFHIGYVHVCMGIIRMWLESRLSSWPSGLCLIMIYTLYSSPDIRKEYYRNCKDKYGKKICLAHKPNWIS